MKDAETFTYSEADLFTITQPYYDTKMGVMKYKSFRYTPTVVIVGDDRRYVSLRYSPKEHF